MITLTTAFASLVGTLSGWILLPGPDFSYMDSAAFTDSLAFFENKGVHPVVDSGKVIYVEHDEVQGSTMDGRDGPLWRRPFGTLYNRSISVVHHYNSGPVNPNHYFQILRTRTHQEGREMWFKSGSPVQTRTLKKDLNDTLSETTGSLPPLGSGPR